MNIFVLNHNPYTAAAQHCDKHVLKMIIEYGQLMSTAHRLLDGVRTEATGVWAKPKTFHLLQGERVVEKEIVKEILDEEGNHVETRIEHKLVIENPVCYNLTHANHPCGIWTRETDANYHWLQMLFTGTMQEYNRRYGKAHAASQVHPFLSRAPRNIPRGQLTPFALAMPDEFKVQDDAVASYQAFYVGSKARFARWTNTPAPEWFKLALKENWDASRFQRTR